MTISVPGSLASIAVVSIASTPPKLSTASKVTISAKLPTSFTPSLAVVLGTMDSWQWNATTREMTVVAFPGRTYYWMATGETA